ncbi:hypothetical protein KOW79_007360 [Hemibagrus wyckioides]|uniref:Uncharacterized protein n=1 Tax=Hemibagrus wyckioides TaxID=337641 RepID=A0A9D3NTM2_9TELE|nr:hypothetical protein KOW79_007360 [Hemibagrus wyckioides]
MEEGTGRLTITGEDDRPVISYAAYTPALLAENCTPIKSNQRLAPCRLKHVVSCCASMWSDDQRQSGVVIVSR